MRRAPDAIVVVAVWALLMVQQLALSLSRPKMFVPLTEGAQEVPSWAATVTTATNAGVVLLALAVALSQWRRAPWHRWPLVAVALVPWLIAVGQLVALGRPPSAIALVYPAVVVAVWMSRPRPELAPVIGALTIATATISILLGVLAPSAGLYSRAAGAELEKPIGPFGILAGVMFSGNDLGLVLVVGVAAVWTITRTWVRWSGLGVVLVAIVWSASRTALAALAVVAVLGLVLHLVRSRSPGAVKAVRWLAAGSLAVIALVMLALPLLVHDATALNNRGRLWDFAIEKLGESPLLGHGADVFKVLATQEDNLGGHASHAHNFAAHVLVSGGLLLAIAFAVLLVLAARRAVSWSVRGTDWATLFLAAVGVCAMLEVPLVLTDRVRQYPFVAVPLLVILCAQPLAAARSRSSSAVE